MDLLTLSCAADTEKLARDCAALFQHGVTILLSGDLGAGKTLFARAFIRAILKDDTYTVPSPTFNLVQTHETPSGSIAHYDLYRIKDSSELAELAIDETARARATLIEWPDRLGGYERYLRKVVRVHLAVTGPDTRVATLDVQETVRVPDTAFVFAAGLGTRMRPLTDHAPKPMVPVAGRPILAYTFSAMKAAGVQHVLVNAHYLPDQIEKFVQVQRPDFSSVCVLHEDPLLETGGGLKRALPFIASDVFFGLNGDAVLVDPPGAIPYLRRLSAMFDPEEMDILLLLQPLDSETATPLIGDYTVDAAGRLTRSRDQTGTHMFAGARLLHRRVFKDTPDGRFSFLELMDRAEAAGRLFGLSHTGYFHHLSTPQDVRGVSTFMTGSGAQKTEAAG